MKPRLERVNGRHPLWKTPVDLCTALDMPEWRETTELKDARQSNPHEWLASRAIKNVEELETLPAGTKPRTPHHRSPGRERRGKRKRSATVFERAGKGHREKDQH